MKIARVILLLCIWTISVEQAEAYDSGNVLSNGGFEKGNLTEAANDVMGSYPWFTSNSGGNAITVTTEEARSGSYSLLWKPIGWNIKEDKTIEDAGTFIMTHVREYTDHGAATAHLSGFVNTSALNPKFRIQVILTNESFTRHNLNTVIAGGLSGWQSFSVSIPLTASDNGMFIAFMAQGTKGTGAPDSYVYIDDLKLVYQGPDTREGVTEGEDLRHGSIAEPNLQSDADKIGTQTHNSIPIGLNHVPKHGEASSRQMAEELGLNFIVGITQWLEPKPGQYVWTGTNRDDFQAHLQELKKEGYKISITFTNVHMDQKHLPNYLKGKRFNDAYLLERWQKYLEAFLLRYGDHIDYLNIGNEVNNYFGKHYDEWSDYLEFFRRGEKVIRHLKPNLNVGVVLVESRRESFWKQIEPYCDHLAITYYTPCSAFGKSPTAEALDENHFKYFARTLNEAIRVSGSKQILITEVGCATHPDIDSSPELQVRFIRALFRWLEGKEDKVLGMSWLAPMDWPYEHTQKALQGYLDAAALQHEPFMKYLTSLGLKYEDGRKKPGYDVFKNEILRYRKINEPPQR